MLAAICLMSFAAGGSNAATRQGARLDQLSPLATQQEIARRLLSPVQREEFERAVARRNARIRPHTVAVGEEAFDLFVPEAAAGERQGLIVFVPPTDAFTVPRAWRGALEQRGLVLVSPRGAGNDADMLERRIPLALHAFHYAKRHYPIDPDRVYVAGFSGGARTAQMIALAYADVFHGVLQVAGSDPFGETAVPPPPAPMMDLVRERLRIVHATGTADDPNIALDARTRRSLAALCVANVSQVDQPRLGHALPEARGFARALDALLQPGTGKRDEGCEQRLRLRIDADIETAQRLLDGGRTDQARRKLGELDRRYGWLAAPRSRELARRLLDVGTDARPAEDAP